MPAFYNEIDPYASRWLRNLSAAVQIAGGLVDDRSIADLAPSDVAADQAHFFAGIGGWSLALRQAGWPDDRPVWTGSCPCQPFSTAGKRKGVSDDRHLWPVWFNLIRECRPPVLFGEQVASPDARAWLDAVSNDLEGAGYAVASANLCASGVGAPHVRQRLYWVAYANGLDGRLPISGGRSQQEGAEAIGSSEARRMGHTDSGGARRDSGAILSPQASGDRPGVRDGSDGLDAGAPGFWDACEWVECIDGKLRPVEPGVSPLAHGVLNRSHKLRAYGNAIVVPLAATFVRSVMDVIG